MSGSLSPEERAYGEAVKARIGIQDKKRSKVDSVKRPIEETLNQALQKVEEEFRVPLRLAIESENAAKEALDARIVSEALNPSLPYPPGTVLEQLKARTRWSTDLVATGVHGIVEVWSKTSDYPSNMSWLPSVGTKVVRLLDKTGKPTKRFKESFYGDIENVSLSGWRLPK